MMFADMEKDINDLKNKVNKLESQVDNEYVVDRLTSILNRINIQISEWARESTSKNTAIILSDLIIDILLLLLIAKTNLFL